MTNLPESVANVTDAPALAAAVGPVTLTVDNAGAAALLSISAAHFYALLRAGKIGPVPLRLGRCRRYSIAELTAWIAAGAPSRNRWQTMKGGGR